MRSHLYRRTYKRRPKRLAALPLPGTSLLSPLLPWVPSTSRCSHKNTPSSVSAFLPHMQQPNTPRPTYHSRHRITQKMVRAAPTNAVRLQVRILCAKTRIVSESSYQASYITLSHRPNFDRPHFILPLSYFPFRASPMKCYSLMAPSQQPG